MDQRFSVLMSRICWLGCWLGAAATGYLLFGLAGHVRSPWLNGSVVLVLCGATLFFLYQFLTIPRETNQLGRGIWAGILAILIVEVLLGSLPPTSRDELTHHLAIPKLYAKAGSIIEVPMAPYSYYPMLLDMLYTPWLYWGYDFVPSWIHGLFAFFTGLLLYADLSRRMNAVYGLLGFFFFISTPVVLRLSHWGYVDLGVTFYTTGSLLCLLRWREDRTALRWLALSALSLGFALATKPNGLVAALVIAFLFIGLSAKSPGENVLKELALFAGLALVPYLPWLAKNWWQTGNPFFPLLANLFGGHSAAPGGAAGFSELGIFARRELLYGENIWQMLALPLRVFFSGQDDHPQFFDGVLTPILIGFLPWVFKGKWYEEKKHLFLFSLLYLAYAVFLVEVRIRYILLIVPALAALSIYGIFNVYLRMRRPVCLAAVLLAFGAWHGSYLWHYFHAADPVGYLTGRENRQAYLTRMLPEYAAFRYIERETSPSAKIYLLFVGRRAYYCERDYLHDYGDLPGYLAGAIRSAKAPADVEKSLRQLNITHLMVRGDLLAEFLGNNLTPGQIMIWNQFASTHLTPVFAERGYSVFQLDG